MYFKFVKIALNDAIIFVWMLEEQAFAAITFHFSWVNTEFNGPFFSVMSWNLVKTGKQLITQLVIITTGLIILAIIYQQVTKELKLHEQILKYYIGLPRINAFLYISAV
jgi:hypothetical protein